MMDTRPSLEARLGRLERQNRTLVVALAGLILVCLVASSHEPDKSTATAFELVDEEGNVRAELALREGSVGLFLKDPAGNDRLRATHDEDGTGLFLQDDEGTTRIGVAQFAHGGGGVALHGPQSKGGAVLYLKDQGSLRFFDGEGRVTNQILAVAADED